MNLFGKNACKEALKSENITINKMIVQEGLHGDEYNEIISLAKARGIKFIFSPKQALNKLAGDVNHQGVILETTEFKYSSIEDILDFANSKNEDPFLLILDEITDPHNLGAIIRTADCAGVHGIIIGKNRSALINETVVKTSSGATSCVKVAVVTNLTSTIEELKAKNIFVYGLELGGNDIYKTNLKGKIALVIGSEGAGMKQLIKKSCDEIITLPQRGQINSLNASVATGICVYEALRQRELK